MGPSLVDGTLLKHVVKLKNCKSYDLGAISKPKCPIGVILLKRRLRKSSAHVWQINWRSWRWWLIIVTMAKMKVKFESTKRRSNFNRPLRYQDEASTESHHSASEAQTLQFGKPFRAAAMGPISSLQHFHLGKRWGERIECCYGWWESLAESASRLLIDFGDFWQSQFGDMMLWKKCVQE